MALYQKCGAQVLEYLDKGSHLPSIAHNVVHCLEFNALPLGDNTLINASRKLTRTKTFLGNHLSTTQGFTHNIEELVNVRTGFTIE